VNAVHLSLRRGAERLVTTQDFGIGHPTRLDHKLKTQLLHRLESD